MLDQIISSAFSCPSYSSTLPLSLIDEFGYQVNTEAGHHVLNESYAYDEDFGKSTKELLEGIMRVSETIPARSVDTNLKRVGWQQCWSKAKEKLHLQFQDDISVNTKLELSWH